MLSAQRWSFTFSSRMSRANRRKFLTTGPGYMDVAPEDKGENVRRENLPHIGAHGHPARKLSAMRKDPDKMKSISAIPTRRRRQTMP